MERCQAAPADSSGVRIQHFSACVMDPATTAVSTGAHHSDAILISPLLSSAGRRPCARHGFRAGPMADRANGRDSGRCLAERRHGRWRHNNLRDTCSALSEYATHTGIIPQSSVVVHSSPAAFSPHNVDILPRAGGEHVHVVPLRAENCTYCADGVAAKCRTTHSSRSVASEQLFWHRRPVATCGPYCVPPAAVAPPVA